MVPANARKRHKFVEKRMESIKNDADILGLNIAEYISTDTGVICAGNVYQYVKEALPSVSVLKLGMVNPLPEKLIREFAQKVKNIVIAEELEPIIETQVKAMGIACKGKELFTVQGEYSAAMLKKAFGYAAENAESVAVPARPPVMCAGCPHGGVFYVLIK
jgi:indolepyruvate ferredoxin oxidoreductase alpha subunit